jgi:uncharacterized protein (DUF2147 family)
MKMRAAGRFAALVTASIIVLGPTIALAGALVEGTWVTPELAEMTIAECPEGYCGVLSKIVITDEQVAQYGVSAAEIKVESITDEFNQDPALRGRPMLGLRMMTLRATSNPWQFEGEIYNPRDGNIYAGYMEVKDADTVVLKGCALYVICQEQVWTRVLMVEGEGEEEITATVQ